PRAGESVMGQREAFLADICEHPADDAPRLIFANWLGLIRLIDSGPDRDAALLQTGYLSAYYKGLTERGVPALLRSPHGGRIDHLDLWSSSLVQEKRAHSRLRRFFKGDDCVC